MCRQSIVVQRVGTKPLPPPVSASRALTLVALFSEFRRSGVHISKDAKGRMATAGLPASYKVSTDAE